MREFLTIPCEGSEIVATLHPAPGETGVVIVTGGTQTRIGSHRGFADLAAVLARAGHPVIRFDRRGVGDSDGEDPGFAGSGPDIAAAAAALRARCPQVARIAGFGLCDGATALALHHHGAGIDHLILANPWVIEQADTMPPPAAIRRRYLRNLTSPAAWLRLLTSAGHIRNVLKGLTRVASAPAQSALADRVAAGLADVEATVILAEQDATALAFADAWRGPAFAFARARTATVSIPTGAHTFAREADAKALAEACIAALG